MKEPDFDVKMLSKNGIDVPQFSGKEHFMLGIYPGNRKMDVIPHTHTYFFILWIRKGEGVHTINFENITIKNNQIFFIAPGEVHKVLYNNDYFDDIAIPFTEDLLNLLPLNIANWIRFELFNNIGKPNIANIDLKTIKVLSMWIKQLEFLLANPNGSTKYCVAFQLSIMLLYLKENATWSNKFKDHDSKKLEIFYKFRKLIDENLKDSHLPAFYSVKIGISEYKLSAITKEVYGLSPMKLINKEILVRAKRLFAENKLIVKEIAECLGFADVPHFANFFKKETGMTPKQFKVSL